MEEDKPKIEEYATINVVKCSQCYSLLEEHWIMGKTSEHFSDQEVEDFFKSKSKYTHSHMCDGMPDWGCLKSFCNECGPSHFKSERVLYIINKLLGNHDKDY